MTPSYMSHFSARIMQSLGWLGFIFGLCLGVGLSALSAAAKDAHTVRLSGFIRARSSELIRPNADQEWAFNIMMLAPEGTRVEPGEVVAKLEGQHLKERLAKEQNRWLEQKVKNEAKINEVKAQIDSQEKTLIDDESELALLEAGHQSVDDNLDWLEPARDRLVEKLDIDLRRLKLALNRKKLARKRGLLAVVQKASQKAAEVANMRIQTLQKAIAASDYKASSKGIVVYRRNPQDRRKVRVGSQVYRGTDVLSIVDDRSVYVQGFLREEDWQKARAVMQAKAPLKITILGRKEVAVSGRFLRISPMVLEAGDWDRSLAESYPLFDTRVFSCDISLDEIPDEAKPDGEVEIEFTVPSLTAAAAVEPVEN